MKKSVDKAVVVGTVLCVVAVVLFLGGATYGATRAVDIGSGSPEAKQFWYTFVWTCVGASGLTAVLALVILQRRRR